MFKRFWNYIKALLGGVLDKQEDPDVLLTRAQQEIRTQNRERAIEAITRKNHLQAMLDDTEKYLAQLRMNAERAAQQGDTIRAEKINREIRDYETILENMRASLSQAIKTANQVKDALRREDERINDLTREALRLKEQGRSSQRPLLPADVPGRETKQPSLTTRGLVILNLFLLALALLLFLLTRQ